MKTVLAVLLLASGAFAQTKPFGPKGPDLNYGPVVSMARISLLDPVSGKTSVSVLGAGAGFQASLGFFPAAFPVLNQKLDLLDVGVVGTAASNAVGGDAALGLTLGTASNLFFVGFTVDALASYHGEFSGFLVGKVSRVNLATIFSLNIFRLYEVAVGGPGQFAP